MRNNNNTERLSPGKALVGTFVLCLITWCVLIAIGRGLMWLMS
jgi:hypothetical protein